jgi:hypothetical protein
MLICEI